MTQKAISLIVVSDTICPWCYLGKARLQQAAALVAEEVQIRVRWEPYMLNPGMPLEGMTRRDYRTAKFGSWEKSQELDAKVEEAAAETGVPINHQAMLRTPNSLLSHAFIAVAFKLGVQNAIVDALFEAYFVKGEDIGDKDVLRKIAAQVGMDEQVANALLAEEKLLEAVKEQAQNFAQAGISGVPTVLYEDGNGQVFQLFSGAQDPHLIADVFRQIVANEN